MRCSEAACRHRGGRLLGAAVAAAAAVTAVGWAAGSPGYALAVVASAVRTGGTDSGGTETVLAAAAGAAAWACLIWFATLVALEAGAALPGLAGMASARLAGRIGPHSARVTARWLIGVTMTATPLVSTMAAPALAAAPGGSLAPLTPASLDRPVATAITRAPAPPHLDRPASREAGSGASSVRHERPDAGGGSAAADYVVRPGDTLWAIAARRLGPHATAAQIAAQWPRWYTLDRTVIGSDPNLIRPGELLRAPPP